MALQAYIDDSKEVGEALVLAGYIAKRERWKSLSDEWEDLLKLAWMPHFKMSEVASRESQEAMELVSAFYRIIEKHVEAAISCVIPVRRLHSVVAELALPPILENPYFLAFKAIVNMTAQHQTRMGLHEPIDFIFDEQSEKNKVLSAWAGYVNNVPKDVQELTGVEPRFESDTKSLQLQAADLFAWWIRKLWLTHGTTLMGGKVGFPWEVKRTIPWLATEFDERGLYEELLKVRRAIDRGFSVAVNVTFGDGKPAT